ncbi:MAG: tRNA pseudouridine(38-40) synthase TruA [Spirochaetales bacterium]|nr:tRNA pseudouridine(38-40) synthase TruA [Spirochaetales bacterium]
MDQRRIALLVAYDGSQYSGWQIQDRQRTVQGEIEEALHQLHKCPTRITGSGRTDTGVHALGQVAHFDTTSSIPVHKYTDALNSLLSPAVRVKKAAEPYTGFHARYDAIEREYEYRILPGTRLSPFDMGFAYGLDYIPDMKQLNRIASVLNGCHDFTTFSAAGDKCESKIRNIASAHFYMRKNMILFVIRGNAFLWRMVRSLVGTILEDERGGGRDYFMMRLNGRDRSMAGATAVPGGLYLRRVWYGKDIF